MYQRESLEFEAERHGRHHHGCGSQREWIEARFAGRHGRPSDELDERFGAFGGGHGRFGRGIGGGRDRMFDAGELKLVILKLLSDQPSYGYQLIKALEERLAGGYSPSAGVIYPTLTMLEEEGLATSSLSDNNKKVYSLTAEGQQYLEANKERIGELFVRIEAVGERFQRRRSPELMKAFMNLRHAVIERMGRRNVKPEQVRKIVEAVNAAAKAIDEL
jgi:DNA-binding PadR family transcriptional regulator